MKLTVNGKERLFAGAHPRTLSELIELYGLDSATVVAEVDGSIIERTSFDKVLLADSQIIELIRFVGGG
ncbi:MAG: sulfur carrier protein ThiS [Phycisphaerae bacterium]|jgi:thiamine biosynthesis protein ThiS